MLYLLPVPKKTVSNLQRCISDFLWNQGEQKRMHWVAWRKVAKPLEEGGLNLKLLADSAYFWKSNLAWSFLKQSSLWATFMNKKYMVDSVSILDSKLWKDLCPIVSELRANSFWRLGKGQVNFFSQRWWPMESSINQQISLPDIPVAEVWADNRRKEVYLAVLPEDIKLYASRIQLNVLEDQLIWKGNDSGIFSSRDFRKSHLSSAGEGFEWWKNFWQPWIPTKISCFVWKCLNHAVPVDEAIQRARIPFVSKCVCCPEGNVETLDHLLLFSAAARGIWDFLHRIFDVQVHYFSFQQAAAIWCQRTTISSQLGCLKILAFSVAVWELWKWRNNCIHANPEDPATIKHKLIYQLQQQNHRIFPRKEASWIEEIALSSLFIHRKRVQFRKGNWVKWSPSVAGITVNFHGAAKHGSAVFRDNKGVLVGSINRYFPEGLDSYQTFYRILNEVLGTEWSSAFSEIQVADKQIFDCMRGNRILPWRWWSQLAELKANCDGLGMKLIDKESNRVAEILSKSVRTLGEESGILMDLPEVKRALFEDRAGIERWSPG